MSGRRNSVRWREAARALLRVARRPDDIDGSIAFLRATEGQSGQHAFARFAASPSGAALLRERPDLVTSLRRLAAYPKGSFAHAAAAFMAREEVGLDDLLQFPQLADQRPMSEAERWFVARVHAMHDLRHVVTGYGVDRFGELCLLAFRTAQHPHPGMRFLCRFGVWKVSRDLPGVPVQSAVREATARGRAAAWLDAAPWETLLPIGLAETQRRLGVQAPAIYAAATATRPGLTTIDAEATVRDAA